MKTHSIFVPTKGFTLVELSIVLVIIGLLISGLLVGQTMIESSKITSTVAQIQQFDTATMSFKSKYKFLPGDAPAFGGDGDGAIEATNSQTTFDGGMSAYSGEIANYWAQAFSGIYKAGRYTTGAVMLIDRISFTGSAKTAPASKLGKANSGFFASTYTNGTSNRLTNTNNYYSIINIDTHVESGFYRLPSSDDGNKTLTAVELLSIDQKIDDAVANTGLVRSGSFPLDPVYSVPTLIANVNCSSGADYLVNAATSGNYECSPFIRIGGMAGNPL